MGKRGPKPKNTIPTEWTPQLAYIVGLITSDGCLSKDGRHIDFTSKDIQLTKLFQKCLGINHIKIGVKTAGSKETYSRIQFGNVIFYEWLISIGLTPKKSKILRSLQIPDTCFFDFVRGCFDGDGSIYSYWDKRWKSSFMFYIAIASGSLPFLLWLKKKIHQHIRIKG
ncbi:MAG: LAGLIDADG family homing endonuclease, partial [Patescibacteria group bacterium]